MVAASSLGAASWFVLLLAASLAQAEGDGTPDASLREGVATRQLAEGEAAAMSPQHSLLLKVKGQLDDPLESLESWVPEVAPCAEGADSFFEGWKYVKCEDDKASELCVRAPALFCARPRDPPTTICSATMSSACSYPAGTWSERRK